MVSCGDFNFGAAHGTFWSTFTTWNFVLASEFLKPYHHQIWSSRIEIMIFDGSKLNLLNISLCHAESEPMLGLELLVGHH